MNIHDQHAISILYTESVGRIVTIDNATHATSYQGMWTLHLRNAAQSFATPQEVQKLDELWSANQEVDRDGDKLVKLNQSIGLKDSHL